MLSIRRGVALVFVTLVLAGIATVALPTQAKSADGR